MNNYNNYYKTSDIVFFDNKDKQKNMINDYGYNFESTKKNNMTMDYSKVYHFVNKDFINNNKIN